MAFSSAAVFAGVDFKSWDVIASADADTGGTVSHGFGAAPADVYLVPISTKGATSSWSLSTVNSTVVTLVKGSTATGSGDASAQIRLYARRPHSIGA